MDNKLKVAVIGVGVIGKDHLGVIADSDCAELVGIFDVDSVCAQVAGKEWQIEVYTTIDALLSDARVDAVVIGTPHPWHATQTMQAAEAGKHVLVEKPMALNLADCDRMVDACESSGVVLMVGHLMRYHSANIKAKALLHEGVIGEIRHVVSRRSLHFDPTAQDSYYNAWYADPQVGGNCALHTVGAHNIDLLPWFMDAPIESVFARGSDASEIYADQADSFSAIFTHQNGVVSNFTVSVVDHSGADDVHFIGTEGSLMVQNRTIEVNGEALDLGIRSGQSMANQLTDFVNCCKMGTEPDASGKSVRHTMAVVDALLESVQQNNVVFLGRT